MPQNSMRCFRRKFGTLQTAAIFDLKSESNNLHFQNNGGCDGPSFLLKYPISLRTLWSQQDKLCPPIFSQPENGKGAQAIERRSQTH